MSRVKTTITDGGLRHHQVTYHLAVQCVMEEISRIRTIPTPNPHGQARSTRRELSDDMRIVAGIDRLDGQRDSCGGPHMRRTSMLTKYEKIPPSFKKPCVFSAKNLPRATTRAMVRRQGLERTTRMRALPSPRPPDLGRQCPAIARFPRAPYLAPRPLVHLTSCAWH